MNEGINRALEGLKPSLEADGFDLRLESVSPDGAVHIALEALPGACMECLVPEPILIGILEQAIRQEIPNAGRVEVHKYNFESHHS